MMFRRILLPLNAILLVFSAFGYCQTPTPTPAPVFKTYALAMSAGNAAAESNKRDDAVSAFQRAAELASSDMQKADALIGVATTEMVNFHTGTTSGKYKGTSFTVYHHQLALRAMISALDLKGITDAKRAEIRLLRADLYDRAMRLRNTYNTLAADLEKLSNKAIRVLIHDEIAALVAEPATPADVKAKALILKAHTYEISPDVFVSQSEMKWAFDALAAAAETVGASDPVKAEALLRIVAIAYKANDSNVYAGAFIRVTQLPNAEPAQKFKAYNGLGGLFLLNRRFDEARQYLNNGLKVKGLSIKETAELYREVAGTYLSEIETSNLTGPAAEKLLAAASAEFAKAVNQPKMSPDERSAAFVGNATFLRFKKAAYFAMAHEQLKSALTVPRVTEKAKAIAQYQIGETYRLEKKFTEAKAAYLLVSKADAQYYGYAQQRIKNIDTPGQITNIDDDDGP